MNKKSNLYAILLIMVLLLVAGITIVIGKFITDKFYTQLNAQVEETPEMIATEAKMKKNWLSFDLAMIILTVILTVGLVVTSFMIPTHPIFVIINILGIFGLVFIGMVMNNVYGEFVTANSEIESTANEYTKIQYLMQYLPYIAAILVFIATIVTYSRGQANATY